MLNCTMKTFKIVNLPIWDVDTKIKLFSCPIFFNNAIPGHSCEQNKTNTKSLIFKLLNSKFKLRYTPVLITTKLKMLQFNAIFVIKLVVS